MTIKNVRHQGFALVTGLIMLLMMTLLAITVMRGTKLELAMTTAVTRQEQAFSLADSAIALARELFIDASQGSIDGGVSSGAVGGRESNIPQFYLDSRSCPDVANISERFSHLSPATDSFAQLGINALDSRSMALRIQTVNASPAHIGPITSTRPTMCKIGKMSMGVVDMGNKISAGTNVAEPEISKLVILIGYGETPFGGYAKVLTISDIQINAN
jgi:hypothetical protein